MERITSLSLILFITLLFPLNISAQQGGPRILGFSDFTVNPFWEFYSENKLSTISAGKGFTGVASFGDISNISLNPASLNIEKRFNTNISYSYQSSIDYLPNFTDSEHLRNGFPSFSIGGGYRINKDLQVGLVYQNNYSFNHVYDMIYMNEFGNEIGRGEAYEKYASHSFYIPIVFNYEWLRLGANLNLTYLRGDISIGEGINYPGYPCTGKGELWSFIPQIGFIITPNEYISFGASYTNGYSGSIDWTYDIASPETGYCEIPSRLALGSEIQILENKLKLSFEYHFANTSAVGYLKDKNNINLGAEYLLDESWTVRSGFFTQFDFRNMSSAWLDNSSYDQFFITLGGTYKYKGLTFNLAFLNSSLLSNSNVAHSVINAGIGYCF